MLDVSCVGVMGGSGLNIDNVLNHIIFIHICVYTQEVIIIAVGNIQVLVSPLNPKLDVLHKCMKFCKRLKGIYVENFPNSVCVNFREVMPSLWNNLLI